MRTLLLLVFSGILVGQVAQSQKVTLIGPQTLFGGGGASGPAIVQTAGPCTTVTTCAFTNPTTTGNSIIGYVVDNSSATPSYGDTHNTFTVLTPCVASSGAQGVVFYSLNITGSSGDTITQTGGNAVTIWMYEVSGGSRTIDSALATAAGCTTRTSVVTPNSSTFSTASANEFVMCAIRSNVSPLTYTAQSGYTLLTQDSIKAGGVESQIGSVSSSTCGITQSGVGNNNWSVQVFGLY